MLHSPPLLTTPAGLQALRHLMAGRPLIAFDFDGTLAPIVARPEDARVSTPLAARLALLARRHPVAVITGRSVDDARPRLGFEPAFVVGSHGAEDELTPEQALEHARRLDVARDLLAAWQAELAQAGVQVEDKGQSLALHYRQSAYPAAALTLLNQLLRSIEEARLPLHHFSGKLVVNLVASGAPDKADAVRRLMLRAGSSSVFFAGDDINDEPVFRVAEPGWLTVRVGREAGETSARYIVDSIADLCGVVDRMLAA